MRAVRPSSSADPVYFFLIHSPSREPANPLPMPRPGLFLRFRYSSASRLSTATPATPPTAAPTIVAVPTLASLPPCEELDVASSAADVVADAVCDVWRLTTAVSAEESISGKASQPLGMSNRREGSKQHVALESLFPLSQQTFVVPGHLTTPEP
ncbi:hypothetical protein BKA80DRAFT_264779 [Phyllosticta citrichinensis]